MGFWGRITGRDVTPNMNTETPPSVGPESRAGDPDGLVLEGEETFSGQLAAIHPSPWDGWPSDWGVPNWGSNPLFEDLVDTAWTCLDLNASVLSTMPVFRTRGGKVIDPKSWMLNPDPSIYGSWSEFCKQLFWDYQMGEAFVLEMASGSDLFPAVFRVIPPWTVNVEFRGNGFREYSIGGQDVTERILHIRYKSTTADARGHGPLEVGKLRMVAAGVLARYATEIINSGGVPYYIIEVPQRLTKDQSDDLLNQWVESRKENLGKPAILANGAKATRMQVSPEELGLTELAQFNESRIAVMLGVPPFLVGLPSGGDSMTYSNVSSLFDFHDRASLRPKAATVMSALSNWALPRGQSVELNRDEYSRPALNERADAYQKLVAVGALSAEEIRTMERLVGEAPGEDSTVDPAAALTGGGDS